MSHDMPDPQDREIQESKPEAEKAGRRLADSLFQPGETVHLSLGGMSCPGCATAIEKSLLHEPGVREAEISFAAEQGRIRFDPSKTDTARLIRAVEKAGYQARSLTDSEEEKDARRQERTLIQLIVSVAFGMQIMILYLVQIYPTYAAGIYDASTLRILQFVAWGLATPVLFYGGSSFLQGAWNALRARNATMDTLVAIGTVAAYGYSVFGTITGGREVYFDSVAMITTFIMLGRYLERVGGMEARKDVRRLLNLQPDRAWRRSNEGWEPIEAASLAPLDEILIKSGERVPADARVLSGEGWVSEALLTGESLAIAKRQGDLIYAGTVLTDDALVASVLRVGAQTRLAQISQLVQKTLTTKPRIQRLADVAAAWFAIGIAAAAGLTFVGWWLSGLPVASSLLAAVAVLVVACPCALGLATPLAISVALGRAAREGIIVRNPTALEQAGKVERIVLDKTGTLTAGRLSVTNAAVSDSGQISWEDLLRWAAAVEQYAEHPIARAIVATAGDSPIQAQGFKATKGKGAEAICDGHRVKVGSDRFVGGPGGSPLAGKANARAENGETLVWVSRDDVVAGFISLKDQIQESVPTALRHLIRAGIRPVVLSGDDPITTAAIARELSLLEFEGRVEPEQKAQRIKAWQQTGERVAMVGDGVNDAPALAQADLSITVASGTDVAGETSDVILTRADMDLVPQFIELSRSVHRIIGQNLGWAFAYNLITLPLAALRIISPIIAAATMATSSLLVVGNSLRLRRWGESRRAERNRAEVEA